jgi:hypothetical protein
MFEALLQVNKNNFPVIPDNGPGPQIMVAYDEVNDLGYFGTLPESDLFTFMEVDNGAKTPLGGTVANRTTANVWIKAYSKGKVIYMPKLVTRTGTSWTSIYKAGYMYGTDDTGVWQPGGIGVNQLTTLSKTAVDGSILTVKVRAIRTYDDMVYPTSLIPAKQKTQEYFGIRWRLNGTSPDPSAPFWANLGSIGAQTMGPETLADHSRALMMNNNGTYLYATSWDITTTSFCCFYPVLEIVSIVRP